MAPRRTDQVSREVLNLLFPEVPRQHRTRRNIYAGGMMVAPVGQAPLPPPPPPPAALPPPPLAPPAGKRELELVEVLPKTPMMITNSSDTQPEYVCNICNRVFNSHYALGGHKAHHSRNGEGRGKAKAPLQPKRKGKSRRRSPTKCPTCDRIFSSPQGYGGHKNHCQDRQRVEAPPEPNPPVIEAPPPKLLMFDLNELPPPEEDEIPPSQPLALPWRSPE